VLASTSGTTAVSRTERTATEEDLPPIEIVGRWPYYLSKIYEEKLVLEHGRKHQLPVVVLNPSLLLGPGDDRLSSTWTVMKFLQRDLPAMPNGGMSFVDVRDAADAFVAALDRGEVGGKHLMGVNMSMSEFFGRLERISGVPAPRLRLPSKVNVAGAKLLERLAEARGHEPALDAASVDIAEHWFWVDPRKAERELGFSPRDPQETLQDTVLDLLSRMPEKQWPGTKGKLAALRRS
jgi:dihydroflavonol-4-reductase